MVGSFIIEGGHPLSGTVVPSGNKNEALPCLAACLLTDEWVTLEGMPKIRDVLTLCRILEGLGAQVQWVSDTQVQVCCRGVTDHRPDPELCARVRASVLLLGPLLARCGQVELPPPGGDIIGARRLDTHVAGATALGCTIEYGHPLRGRVGKLLGAEIDFDEPSVTATENILMMAALASGASRLRHVACEPHVVGLTRMLEGMGARISGRGSNQLRVEGVDRLGGVRHRISPDFMEVGSFLCLGAIAGGRVRIEGVCQEDMRFPLKTLGKIGIRPKVIGDALEVDGSAPLETECDLSGRVATIYSGPWPCYPTDLMSVAIVAATQCRGTLLFHEKMFEGRMFFTDKLMAMGANIVLCDPHRVVVTGRSALKGARMSSPDVRAGMALVMAACVAEGTSRIDNVYQVERAYYQVAEKLRGLGCHIEHRHAEG